MEELKIAIENIEKAVNDLRRSSDEYYKNGDNYRGNIRYDAALRLFSDLERLKIANDYITIALKK